MNKDGWFIINDFDGFVNHTRVITFNAYGKKDSENEDDLIELTNSDQQELDQVLSYNESVAIIKPLLKKEKNKKTQKIRYIINDNLYLEIIQSLSDRMTSNILHSLVKKGLVESAFDTESNDFVFWIKDEDKEKPETD